MKEAKGQHAALAHLIAALVFALFGFLFFARPLFDRNSYWMINEYYIRNVPALLLHALGLLVCVAVGLHYAIDAFRKDKMKRKENGQGRPTTT